MTADGFFEQKRMSPTGLALVVAMHASALGALALVKGPEFIRPLITPTIATFIPLPEDPPPNPPPVDQPVRQPTTMTALPPVFERQTPGPPVYELPPLPPAPPAQPPAERVELARVELPPTPVRVAAMLDPRYAGALQPPYPPAEERAQRGGTVRMRVTIGTDGRVKAIERLSATSDLFWRATERHALNRWRFRPATLDGRPVESSKLMTVTFRIEG